MYDLVFYLLCHGIYGGKSKVFLNSVLPWLIIELLETHSLFSAQICARCTIVSTALFISCTLTNSSFEWIACSPANRLGQGNPINDKRLPSVPPRILSIFN